MAARIIDEGVNNPSSDLDSARSAWLRLGPALSPAAGGIETRLRGEPGRAGAFCTDAFAFVISAG